MSTGDSPTSSARSERSPTARPLAAAACLIIGLAAVSVRAVVVNRAATTGSRAITPLRARASGNPLQPAVTAVSTVPVAAPVAAPVGSVTRRGVGEAPLSSANNALVAAGPTPAVETSGGASPGAESALASPVVFAQAAARAASSARASTPGFPDPVRRAPLDWRALVSHAGVTFSATEITDASAGSAALRGARSLRTHSNLELTLDMDSLVRWRGLTLYAQYKTKTGRNGSGEAAFVQNFSNIDAGDFRAMGEAWIEQRLLRNRLSIKAGRIDFNSAFAGTDNGASFLNASMGYSPSIVAAPTFPLPTLGVEATVSPWSLFSVGVGVFNGLGGAPAPVGGRSRFQIAQANQQWALGTSQLAGRLGAGGWRHTGLFAAVASDADAEPGVAGTSGWYATLDQTLRQGRSRDGDATNHASIGAFAQVGTANPNVQSVHAHHGGGLTLAGLLAARPDDVVGLGVTRASWSTGRETIGELFYQLPISSHFSVVADVQHVRRFDGLSARAFGNVATMRTVLTF